MAETTGSGFHKRKPVRRVAFGLGLAILLYGGASLMAIREAKDTERRAGRFLREFVALEPESATLEQVTALIRKYGAHWVNVTYRRDEISGGIMIERRGSIDGMLGTQFEFEFTNRSMALLQLAPSASFSGAVFVTGGRVIFRMVGFSSGRERTYFVAHVAEDNVTTLGKEGYSMRLEPYKTLIHLTPSASKSLRERAYGFNLTCLSKIGGCKDARDVLPRIYERAREVGPGHWVFEPQSAGTP